ncbi:MAG: hypothetical protein B7Z70_11330, partial [Acidithiobacillus ferrivorans]
EKPLILVVDDENDLREIISTKLTASGFDAVVAYNATEAVDAAKKIHPDLILMDIHMPGPSGTDAALQIKQDPATKDIKIAFLSNLKDPWPQTMAPEVCLSKNRWCQGANSWAVSLGGVLGQLKKPLAVT